MAAIAYLRRSSAPNADTRSVSFEMQQAAIAERAAREGDTITETLTDWAKSGGTDRRPGYQELLKRIAGGGVRRVYAYSLSRLSRSMIDYAALVELCRKHDVSVLFTRDNDLDLRTASSRGYAGMVAVFAQMEREIAQERVQSAVSARRDRGDHMGQAPYGFRVVEGRLERRDDEDPGAVLAAFRDAGSFGGAARLLNERKIPTRRCTPRADGTVTSWNHGTVADIIRQQFPAEAPLATARARAKTRTGSLLAGLLRCTCGSTLTPRRFQGITTYYCARSYRVPGHGKTTVREVELMPWVRDEAARFRIPGDQLETMLADEAERASLSEKRERIIDLMTDATITKAEGQRRLATVESQMAALDRRRVMVDIPQEVDWSWPPDTVNAFLRAIWNHVELGDGLRPLWADWGVPAEYVA